MTAPRRQAMVATTPDMILPHLSYLWGCARRLIRHPMIARWYGTTEDVHQALCVAAIMHGLRLYDPARHLDLRKHLVDVACARVFLHAYYHKGRRLLHLEYTNQLAECAAQDTFALCDAHLDIAEAFRVVTPDERRILGMFYGLDGYAEHSLCEIAEALGQSLAAMQQRKQRIVMRLRSHFAVERCEK